MKGIGTILTAIFVLIGLIGCSSESRKVTLHKPGVYKGTKDPLLAKQEATGIDRSLQISPDRSLKKGGLMVSQTDKRTFSFLVLGILLLLLAGRNLLLAGRRCGYEQPPRQFLAGSPAGNPRFHDGHLGRP